MSLLVVSPDFASHYGPLAVLAGAARSGGHRVVVATGPTLRSQVEADGFEWTPLALSASSNDGVVADSPAIGRFITATGQGPVATIGLQARERQRDLLWQPERVGRELGELCERLQPDEVLVDHVSFGSTLALHATGRSFVTLVPGHPSQLPVGDERYGIPARWPAALHPDGADLADLVRLVDEVTAAFTDRWNAASAALAPDRPAVADAFRVHGRRVLYNTAAAVAAGADPDRCALQPADHRFVGPLVRDEALPDELRSWGRDAEGRPRVYVALGTFLSRRGDVLARIAEALRGAGAVAAVAVGPTPIDALGPIPDGWLVRPRLPQVALLAHADLAVHHGGNNTVQEATAAGVRQVVLPFSTDQFAAAADLEQAGRAAVLSPNDASPGDLAAAIASQLAGPRPVPVPRPSDDELVRALFD